MIFPKPQSQCEHCLVLALYISIAGHAALRFTPSACPFADGYAARRWVRSKLIALSAIAPRLVPLAAILAEVDAPTASGWLRPESVARRLRELERQVAVVVRETH